MFYLNAYINLCYFGYFVVLDAILMPVNKHFLIPFAILGLILKLVIVKLYIKDKPMNFIILRNIKDFLFLFFILTIVYNSFFGLKFYLGLTNVVFYLLIFLIGYLIGVKEKEVEE